MSPVLMVLGWGWPRMVRVSVMSSVSRLCWAVGVSREALGEGCGGVVGGCGRAAAGDEFVE